MDQMVYVRHYRWKVCLTAITSLISVSITSAPIVQRTSLRMRHQVAKSQK
ncbi:unnamed protein product [Anisakis simplex]|uniref:Secreted protein n=1 Tax=Anisakis simplex TaxID=6269 RepID=A0A0M3JD25_ANISI|nr:unnamed protein product [Anisakis simplex]